MSDFTRDERKVVVDALNTIIELAKQGNAGIIKLANETLVKVERKG